MEYWLENIYLRILAHRIPTPQMYFYTSYNYKPTGLVIISLFQGNLYLKIILLDGTKIIVEEVELKIFF